MNPDQGLTTGVKYVSLHEPSGYGIAAKRYLRGLINRGVPLTWAPMIQGPGWGLGYEPFLGSNSGDELFDPYCNSPIDYDTVVIHTVPEYFPLWAEREAGKRLVGYTVWETDRIPGHWYSALNSVDRLMVPCKWNRTVFKRCGVNVPISVVPHITEQFTHMDSAVMPNDIRSTDFVFYTIGTWTNRKAIWKVLQSYWDTFSDNDDTVLVIKTTGRDFTRSFLGRFHGNTRKVIKRLRRRYDSPARICVITQDVDDEFIRVLHRRGDCFVSLCRSEGWGLGAFDAAAAGNPVIITGFGGQLDYLPAHVAHLVRYTHVPVDDSAGKKSYSPDQRWAEPDIAHASELMRSVFEDRSAALERGGALKKHVQQHFGERVVTERFLRAVRSES